MHMGAFASKISCSWFQKKLLATPLTQPGTKTIMKTILPHRQLSQERKAINSSLQDVMAKVMAGWLAGTSDEMLLQKV